jgi:hypothetical protein
VTDSNEILRDQSGAKTVGKLEPTIVRIAGGELKGQ